MKKVAILGYGGRGYHYAKMCKKMKNDYEVVAVIDNSADKRRLAKEMSELSDNQVFASLDDFLLAPKTADWLFVCTQDKDHKEHAVKGLKKGYHLLLEKPVPICEAMELMEFGEGTVWAYCEPDHFKSTLDELHRRQMINLKNMLETQVVDMYRVCGPEYATPPYMSPEFFKKYVYPYLCEITDLIHSYGAKVRIHSHGKIGQVLDMIIDSGADATDPCEAPPDGDITLADAKRRAGDKLTIFGNIELKLLENGTPDEVKKEVIKCMESAKDGGRYVIMPTASPINIPLSPKTEENYKVFIDTALEYGGY